MFDQGFFLSWQAVRRQLAAMPNDLYLVRLIHQTTRRAFPGERLWTATQLVREPTIRFLRMRNREGCDIYIQPYSGSGNPGYILLDLDHGGPAALNLMRTHRLTPCVVLQTSPGHLAGLDSSQCHSPGTGHRRRHCQTIGPVLWGRLGQRRLAPSGKAGWLHQPEAPAAPGQRLRSLGATPARRVGLGQPGG